MLSRGTRLNNDASRAMRRKARTMEKVENLYCTARA